jgi:hypothetical protein
MLPFWMYMTASLGCPWEKTIFPLEYVITRRAAPADVRKASASKAGGVACGRARGAFGFGIERIISRAAGSDAASIP